MPVEADVIYAAGFFDGEGCITIARGSVKAQQRRVPSYSLCIQVSQVIREPLELFKSLWGGSIHDQQDIHAWHARCKIAACALEDMLPHLRVKKTQAELGLAFQSMKKPGSPVSIEEADIRNAMNIEAFEMMRELKKAA